MELLDFSMLGQWPEPATAAVTAAATLVLAILTGVLARATILMARASSEAHVIASLEINQWSINHMDLVLSNAGNAPAYQIKLEFDPSIPTNELRQNRTMPFQNVSLMRPGQSLTSSISDYESVKDQKFRVKISWKRRPKSWRRQYLEYDLDLKGLGHMSFLGARNPDVQVAEQIKHLREDWRSVSTGYRRLKSDI